jgi:heme exporter protein C
VDDRSLPRRLLVAGAALALPVFALLGLVAAPAIEGFRAPASSRILYVHVPAAWVGYLALAVTLAGSIRVLAGDGPPPRRVDALAAASAETGTLFGAVALATGLLWARVEFVGYSPFSDPKVVTLVALVAAYAGYLALRLNVDDPVRRARLGAVYAVAASPAIPASYLASKVSLHPDFTAPGAAIGPDLLAHLLAATLLLTLVAAGLVLLRARVLGLAADLDEARAARREGSP